MKTPGLSSHHHALLAALLFAQLAACGGETPFDPSDAYPTANGAAHDGNSGPELEASSGEELPALAAPSGACSRFKPGHYFYVGSTDPSGKAPLASLKTALSRDLHSFTGVVYDVLWGTVETAQGAYDFGTIDQALALAKSEGKYLLIFFKDRTFHLGCSSKFIPDYIARSVGYDYKTASIVPRLCYAAIWDAATIKHETRVMQKLVTRYKSDPYFLGISLPEEAVAAQALVGHTDLRVGVYELHRQLYAAVHGVSPSTIMHQMMNWPHGGDISHFEKSASVLVGLGGGGAMGWPDSVPSKAKLWNWYQVARDNNKKLAIIAHAQTPYLGSSVAATEEVYNFLVNDINAHAIVWGLWHKEVGGAYFTDRIIPVVNAHGGKVKNTTCPWPP